MTRIILSFLILKKPTSTYLTIIEAYFVHKEIKRHYDTMIDDEKLIEMQNLNS